MHVWTFKFNRRAAVAALIALAVVLTALTLSIGAFDRSAVSTPGAKNAAEGAAYLESLGWHISDAPAEEKTVLIPREFSEVYEAYNRLQRSQGFDLSDYRGKQVTIYTYTLESYEGYTGDVAAELYVCGGRVIGGDVHTLELDGFMHGIK